MMSLGAVLDLWSIAKRMVAGRYIKECVQIYGQTRKSVIEGCLNRIGVDRLSTSDVQKMEWGILDIKIKKWMRALKIAVRILFTSEKWLCDEIFSGLNNVSDSCFTEVVKGPMTKLLEFGESVAMSKRSGCSTCMRLCRTLCPTSTPFFPKSLVPPLERWRLGSSFSLESQHRGF